MQGLPLEQNECRIKPETPLKMKATTTTHLFEEMVKKRVFRCSYVKK